MSLPMPAAATTFDGAHQLRADAQAGLCAKAVRLFAEHILQRALDALRRRYDLHIGFAISM